MDKHTPELWTADGEQVLARDGGSDYVVAECYGPTGRANAVRIAAAVNACKGIPTEALEAGVIRDLIDAATRYLRVMTRDTDDDPYCWAEGEFAEDRLREVLAKVRGDA